MPFPRVSREWFEGFAKRLEQIHADRPELAPRSSGGHPSVLTFAIEEEAKALGKSANTIRTRWHVMGTNFPELVPDFMLEGAAQGPQARNTNALTIQRLVDTLGRLELTTAELCSRLGASTDETIALLESAQSQGFSVLMAAGRWRLDRNQQPAFLGRVPLTHYADADGWHRFGVCTDNHMGSKYSRLDVVESLYDHFAAAGLSRVYNCGNWIDGEAGFNRHDLIVHGMDAQCRYLAEHYPKRDGITTYAVAGDDHEGWYAQREGVDIGRYAERVMREAGRTDWVDLGYMEAPVLLQRRDSDKASVLTVVHPGGGSSYALSYSIQKIIESLDGGEKPAIGLYGHYHKLWTGNIRNVWCVQAGTTQDQTPFMRKKKLEAHVGGVICEAYQDPETGAITRFRTEIIRYFNKGFATDRWSHSGPVVHGHRAA